jgi:hypothetical protein
VVILASMKIVGIMHITDNLGMCRASHRR